MGNLRIRHFLYNAFLIEDDSVKIAIDPGLNMWLFGLGSLIPKPDWSGVTHILVTHGDPDHYWYADRMAEASGAPLICGSSLVQEIGGEARLLGPRSRGIQYPTRLERVYPLDVGEMVEVDGVTVEGLKTVHGPLVVKALGLKLLDKKPGPGERIGLGAIGFKVTIGSRVLVTLGDTLLQQEWKGLRPDVLMIPIGGQSTGNTMNVEGALEAVRLSSPKRVIPVHYNCGFLWTRKLIGADPLAFQSGAERMGVECSIMRSGEELTV